MVSIQRQMVAYLVISLAIYLFALIIASILKVTFGITFTSYGGEEVDVTTYIVFGAIDLILELFYIGVMIGLVLLIWIWNGIFVGFLFKLPILTDIFGGLGSIPEETIPELSAALIQIKDMIGSGAFQPLRYSSQVTSGFFTGITETIGDLGEFAVPFLEDIVEAGAGYVVNIWESGIVGGVESIVEGFADGFDQIAEGITDAADTFTQGLQNGADAFDWQMNEAANAVDDGDLVGGAIHTGAAVVQGAGNAAAGAVVAGAEVTVGVAEAGIEVGQGIIEGGACLIGSFFGGSC